MDTSSMPALTSTKTSIHDDKMQFQWGRNVNKHIQGYTPTFFIIIIVFRYESLNSHLACLKYRK